MSTDPFRRLSVVLALASLGLAACADAPRTSVTYQNPNSWQFVQGFVTGSGLLVDVRGRPYGDDEARLNETVTTAMKQAVTWSSTANFTTDADKAASRATRVVMAFNGSAALGSYDQCAGRGEGGGPQPNGSVQVVATLCSENEVLSNVQGHIGETTGVSDPRFAALIRQLTRELLPRGDFWRENGTGIRVGGGLGSFGIGVGGVSIRLP